ncbi:MAG: sigma-70 family RNA polymerase sigma factor [Planctomycetaceae bacterium]
MSRMGDSSQPQNQLPSDNPAAGARFQTTQWTVVLAAGRAGQGDSQEALAELCRTYWYPVYAYIRRRIGDIHESQDLTQAFFEQLLEKATISSADPERGRFRSFLLTACKRFLINEWQKARAEKRGGGQRPLSLDFDSAESRYSIVAVDNVTPERLFERQWAMTLLSQVLGTLKDEYAARGKSEHFEALKTFLSGRRSTDAYAAAAESLGLSDGAVKVAAHRMRQRYRELIRSRIADTVEDPEDVDSEIHGLFAALGR